MGRAASSRLRFSRHPSLFFPDFQATFSPYSVLGCQCEIPRSICRQHCCERATSATQKPCSE
ncbi:hypothetical protein C8Q79DRAFT_958866 [Trametes meyenii]|nr:hypothetical protein C8Q79DRAFT_958866 [Trametes meyenii]